MTTLITLDIDTPLGWNSAFSIILDLRLSAVLSVEYQDVFTIDHVESISTVVNGFEISGIVSAVNAFHETGIACGEAGFDQSIMIPVPAVTSNFEGSTLIVTTQPVSTHVDIVATVFPDTCPLDIVTSPANTCAHWNVCHASVLATVDDVDGST